MGLGTYQYKYKHNINMFTGNLKPYQTEAVDRMVDKKTMLVAYEMGLGKEQPIS
jgi:superfamily II DNA or RNA helicase